jgi:Ohr subfamily peroxiredoxin
MLLYIIYIIEVTKKGKHLKILYTAEATAHGGREGHVRSSDGHLEADLSIPEGLGGPGGPGTNPEQLFAAGYAACFENAMIVAARRLKKTVTSSSVTAQVGIGAIGGGALGLQVALHIHLIGVGREDAEALVATAHQVCPYSNATRGNIEVDLILEEPVALATAAE